MARLTASGAPSGAAAWPKRRRARVPGTVGPEAGKIFAFAEDAIAAKRAAPTTILGLRGYTTNFGACLMPQDFGLQRKNWGANDLFGVRSRSLLRNELCYIK